MTKLLIRGTKSPFDAISAERMLRDNLIANNSGNLLFLETAWKVLSTHGTEITPDRLSAHRLGAERINERFDHYVIPLANAFRQTYEESLARLTRVIEKLTIPVTVLGVGVQFTKSHQPGATRPFDDTVKAFARAVLDRSPSIGVRGEVTRDYLGQLGFREVEVIGCPSMFLNGERLAVAKRTPVLGRDARIGIGVTPRIPAMGPIVMSHVERYPNLEYLAQDIDSLRLLLWGEEPKEAAMAGAGPLPIHLSHPLLRDDKSVFFVDPWPWLDHMRETDFVFGTRIHGSIAAVLAGTPGYLFAHDARTLELARYFQLPHRALSEVPPDVDAADLYEEADFGPLIAGHPERFRRFTAYLESHGLRHVFQPGESTTAFDERLATVRFPPPVRVSPVTPVRRTRRRAWDLAGQLRMAARQRLRRA
jgi:Polysaccharide pyruvyl transferase